MGRLKGSCFRPYTPAMLIDCPECGRRVSDRAAACPDCGFPVREHVAEQAELEAKVEARKSRERVGEVDCPVCDARGFQTFVEKAPDGTESSTFAWCEHCKHSGRSHLCRDIRGYYAVSYDALEAFLAGTIDDDHEEVFALGDAPPKGHRYTQAGEVFDGPGDGVEVSVQNQPPAVEDGEGANDGEGDATS